MFRITSVYKFTPILQPRIEVIYDEVVSFCSQHGIKGLFLLSSEGCNGTLAGSPAAIGAFKEWFGNIPEFKETLWKDCDSDVAPFKRLKVDIREEIVTLKKPDFFPQSTNNNHLSPKEWHQVLQSEKEEILLLDTRNFYETDIGMFKGAVDPNLQHFSEFPKFVKSKDIPKNKKILMYCTGGIRCEKALVYMQHEGFKNVFQLEGGILNYLKEYPYGEFEGECFVFDHRVSVDTELKPTKQYSLCPHCGNPGKEHIVCDECGNPGVVCHRCLIAQQNKACSKNCSYHLNTSTRGRSPSYQ